MSKFQVGDRVKVYGHWGAQYLIGSKGTIKKIELNNPFKAPHVAVKLDIEIDCLRDDGTIWVHPKQCRKLVKKERRRVWINMYGHSAIAHLSEARAIVDAAPYVQERAVEFVEVRKKK